MRVSAPVDVSALPIVWNGDPFVPGLLSLPVGLTKTPTRLSRQPGASFGSLVVSQLSGGGPSLASLGHVDVCVQSVPPPPQRGAKTTMTSEPKRTKSEDLRMTTTLFKSETRNHHR